jgi:MFS family permease
MCTLAIKGDDSDGKVPMTPKRYIAMLILFMSYVGMSPSNLVISLGLISSDFWVPGAQLPLFFMGGCLTFIVEAVDNTAARGWATTAYGVSLAAVTPFAGYLQDLMGRRYIAILGAVLVCTGLAVIGSAHSFVQLICGTVIAGVGAGATELASIAG